MSTTTPVSSTITIATSLAVSLRLQLPQNEWISSYNRVEVWRSRVTEQGPYEEVTGEVWGPATLYAGGPGSAPSLAPIVGKSLNLLVNGTVVSITFTGVDPLTRSQISAQIAAANPAKLTSSVTGTLIALTTVSVGSGAVLQITGGDAAPLLGLSVTEPGSIAFGHSPRISLVSGIELYDFTDYNGSATYFYKVRYRHATTGTVSEYSIPVLGASSTNLPPDSLVRGYLDLADGFGRPVYNTQVLLYAVQQFLTVSGKTVLGVSTSTTTDRKGHVEFMLVRGMVMRVSVSGTNMVKEFTVPVNPTVTSFNMFDPAYSIQDPSQVQVPSVDFAVRRAF